MFVVAILSICAAISFRRLMSEKGYDGRRVSWYPIIAGAIVIALGPVLNAAADMIIKDDNSVLLNAYPSLIGIFSILIHGAFVAKLWRQIKKLPSQSGD